MQTTDCLDINDLSNHNFHRQRLLVEHEVYQPRIQPALQNINFQFRFHSTRSFINILREYNYNVIEEGTVAVWDFGYSESQVTVLSMSASSCSSTRIPSTFHDRGLRSSAQQTDISCRFIAGMGTPAPETEEAREARVRVLADSVTASGAGAPSPPSSARSRSILGSVCALLLAKQVQHADSILAVKGSHPPSPKEVPSVTGSLASENICRICFDGASSERLERPCCCRGTIAAVHRSCLERWLLQASTSYCELCRHHYIVTRSHKWSWMVSLVEWARSPLGRALACDVWRGALLGAASVLGTARALQACDAALQAGARQGGPVAFAANLFSSLLIGVIGALNGLLTTWILLKIQEHQLSWRTWRDSTLHVRVVLDREHEHELVERTGPATANRSTNIADPFMVALPYSLPEP